MVKVGATVHDKKLQAALKKAGAKVSDLSTPFKLITESWYRSNRAIFNLKGPGKYADLKPDYKKAKQREYGFVYPILKATGRLERSMVDPSGSEGVRQVINKKALFLGTKVPYAGFLQQGTRRMKARPVVLIGSEQVSPPGLNRRLEAWIAIIEDYVEQVHKKEGL